MNLWSFIKVLITLGTQPDCNGLGICKIENITMANKSCEICIEATLENEKGEIKLRINERKMDDKIFIKFFTTQHFIVKQDFYLPIDISKELGLNKEYLIKKGAYTIHEEDQCITIKL